MKVKKVERLEEYLVGAMRAVDNQIARMLQRSPEEVEASGVQKWEPYQRKVEQLSKIMLDAFGDQSVQLDSILVFSQAFLKSLKIIVEDLDREGLGNIRTQYCRSALDNIEFDARSAISQLKGENHLM